MSGFGSINDLLGEKKERAAPPPKKGGAFAPPSADPDQTLKKKIGEIALKEKEQEVMRAAAAMGVPHIDLEKFPVSQNALRQVPEQEARNLSVVCFYASQDEFRLGAVDPSDAGVAALLSSLEERLHAHGVLYAISEKSLNRILLLYAALPVVKPITKDVEMRAEDLQHMQATIGDFHSLQKSIEKTNTTDILAFLLAAGLKLNASDVHVEAEEKGIVVRLRLDGVLHEAAVVSKDMYSQLVSRIKLLSSLKINITDAPQDGRFSIKMPEGSVDVRVSTIPTVYGESIVMRLLRQGGGSLSLPDLGFRGSALGRITREIERPNGMIITTGPTGSGKTTTMYAILKLLNKPGVKIITLEDPVEYKMEGINQSQVDPGKGYTFGKGLRSLLRQDPDIAMVGEIRDLETADIAIQAALTGHLILSTIHTNSAAGAIPRFLSMGVKPFLLAPALNAVVGQRLVRRLCESCKKPSALSAEDEKRVAALLSALPESERSAAEKDRVFYDAPGCHACNGLGYAGRVGIHEVFQMNPEVEKMILSGSVSEFDIQTVAVAGGMVTMAQDGVMKALDGLTSVGEVFRVIE